MGLFYHLSKSKKGSSLNWQRVFFFYPKHFLNDTNISKVLVCLEIYTENNDRTAHYSAKKKIL